MPKISIYVPDALYAEIRGRDIPVSAVAQRALEEAVHRTQNRDWVERARTRAERPAIDTSELMKNVREEFGA